MALNRDFRVKDSLYVGGSAYFAANNSNVAIDAYGQILSSGVDLYDIFQNIDLATLSNGDGIDTFTYDGDSTASIAVDSSVIRTFGNQSLSGTKTFTGLITAANVSVRDQVTIGTSAGNGSLQVNGTTLLYKDTIIGGGTNDATFYVYDNSFGVFFLIDPANNLVTTTGDGNIDGNLTLSGNLAVVGTVDGRDISNDGITLDIINTYSRATSAGYADTKTVVNANSAGWIAAKSTFNTNSASYAAVRTVVNSNSARLLTSYTFLTANSASYAAVRSVVTANSATWGNSIDGSGTSNYIPLWSDSSTLSDSIISQNAGADTVTFAGNATITGDLSVRGGFTYIDTSVTVTSALSVVNEGTGPALFVKQTGANPIAHFIDSNGDDILFQDNGQVLIGVGSGSAKLTVNGSISSNDVVYFPSIGTGEDNSVVILDSDGTLRTDEIDPNVWNGTLVNNGGTGVEDAIPRYSDSNVLTNSNITDDGTLVTIDSNTTLGDGSYFRQYDSSGTYYSDSRMFYLNAAGAYPKASNSLTTFTKSGLKSVKYNVTLASVGSLRTVFEMLVTYTPDNSAFGTVYGIVDAQATSLLEDIDISTASTTIDLQFDTSADCACIVHGIAYY